MQYTSAAIYRTGRDWEERHLPIFEGVPESYHRPLGGTSPSIGATVTKPRRLSKSRPAGQSGGLPDPLRHLFLVEFALVDVDPT